MALGRSILLKLTGDPSDARRAIHEVERDVKDLDGKDATVRAEIKTAGFNAQMEKLQTRLRNLDRQTVTPDIKIKRAAVIGQIEKIEDKLDKLDKDRTINVRVRETGGAGGVGGKGGKLGGLGGLLGGAGALAGAGVTAGTINAVQTSSSVDEALSKNKVLFGSSAKSVEEFSKKSAAGLGVSKKEALEATGQFGALLRTLGIGPEKAAKMSIALTKLGADLASFHNKPIADALGALQSGLVGESEPLRQFAVNLNDDRLRREAKRLGLTKDIKSPLTAKQKGIAVNSLVFGDTKPAQGDVQRTKGGLANQIKIIRAELQDRLGELGDKLKPTVTRVARVLSAAFAGRFKAGLRPLRDILISALKTLITIPVLPLYHLGKLFGKGIVNGLIEAINFGIRQVNKVLGPRDLGPLGHTPDLRLGEITPLGEGKGGVKLKDRKPSRGNAGDDPRGVFKPRLAPNVTVQVSTPGGGSPDPRVLADQLGREIRRRGG